jgi:hypothetical protein
VRHDQRAARRGTARGGRRVPRRRSPTPGRRCGRPSRRRLPRAGSSSSMATGRPSRRPTMSAVCLARRSGEQASRPIGSPPPTARRSARSRACRRPMSVRSPSKIRYESVFVRLATFSPCRAQRTLRRHSLIIASLHGFQSFGAPI